MTLRVYGLSRLSVSVSAGEGDTLTKYDNIAKFQQHFSTNRRNSIQTRKLLYYHAKLGYYHGNC